MSKNYQIRSVKGRDNSRSWAVCEPPSDGSITWQPLPAGEAERAAPELAKILDLIPDGLAPNENCLAIAPTGHLTGRRFCTIRAAFFEARTPYDIIGVENGCVLSQPAAQAAAPNLSAALSAFYGTEAVPASDEPTSAEKGLRDVRQAMSRPEGETLEQEQRRMGSARADKRGRAVALVAQALGGDAGRAELLVQALELMK